MTGVIVVWHGIFAKPRIYGGPEGGTCFCCYLRVPGHPALSTLAGFSLERPRRIELSHSSSCPGHPVAYTSELIDLLNVLGLLVELEP
jgi:hypothetical protein